MLRLFQRQAPEQAAHIEVAHDGEIYRVALKRVATSRRFTLRVRTATRDALLTMPSRSSLKAAREFADRFDLPALEKLGTPSEERGGFGISAKPCAGMWPKATPFGGKRGPIGTPAKACHPT